jgi:hypothetical protein
LSRLRGRSRFGDAKARASTFFVLRGKAWMAGTGPAMTERVVQACRPAKFFTVTPSRSSMISAIIWRWQWVWSRS